MARIQGGGDQELHLLSDLGQLQSFLILASSPEKWSFRQCLPGDDPFLGRGLDASRRGMQFGSLPSPHSADTEASDLWCVRLQTRN